MKGKIVSPPSSADASTNNLKDELKTFRAILSRLGKIKPTERKSQLFDPGAVASIKRSDRYPLLREAFRKEYRMNAYEDIRGLSNIVHRSYGRLKGAIETRVNTHRYITREAIKLTGLADRGISGALVEYCTFPDEPRSDMNDLMYEGHFYGKIGGGKYGNFILKEYPGKVVSMMDRYKKATNGPEERIDEHAVSNFGENIRKYLSSGADVFHLGVAAHYLQDLTAPHHAGNYPAFPYIDHYIFEQFASSYVHGSPGFTVSDSEYESFRKGHEIDLSTPEEYAKTIHREATAFVRYIEKDLNARMNDPRSYSLFTGKRSRIASDSEDIPPWLKNPDIYAFIMDDIDRFGSRALFGSKEWEKAIDGAVPLAVYATARLIETAFPCRKSRQSESH